MASEVLTVDAVVPRPTAFSESIWQHLSPREQHRVFESMERLQAASAFACPHCGTALSVDTSVSVRRVRKLADVPGAQPQPASAKAAATFAKNDPDERLIADAHTSGLMAALEQAVREEKGTSGVPADLNGFLLHFLKVAVKKRVDPVTLATYLNQFPHKRVDFFAGEGIVAVTANGAIVALVPQKFILPGQDRRKATGNNGALKVHFSPQQGLERWIKGRFGYVPAGSPLFSDALRKRNVGEFDR